LTLTKFKKIIFKAVLYSSAFFCLKKRTKTQIFNYTNMIVLTPSGSQQTFYYVPRVLGQGVSEQPLTMVTTDEQTNTPVSTINHFYSVGNYVNSIQHTYALIEGHFYTLELKNSNNDVIYKDRIFCTAQPLVTFSVNNNQYVSNSTTNDFIVYE